MLAVVTSGRYNSRGMQEPEGILVVHVGPLLQESIDVWQASPLPAGGTGEHQGERAHLRVTVISLLPQSLLISISEPAGGEWAPFTASCHSEALTFPPP